MGQATLKKMVRTALFFLAVGLLVWLLDRIGWDEIGISFERVGWMGAAALLTLGFLETFLDSAAFNAALFGRVGALRAMAYSGAGAVVNIIIPWEAGEAVKGTLLTRHVSTSEAIRGTVLWNYLFKLSRPAVALVASLFAVIVGHGVDPVMAWLVVGASVVALAPYFVFKLLLHFGVMELGVRFLKRVKVLRRDTQGIAQSAHELDQRIRSFKKDSPTAYFSILVYQSFARVVALITWGLAMRLVGLDFGLGLIALLYAALSVSGYLVMLFPVRIGVTEGTGYLVFALFGLDGGMGLIVAVIMRLKGLLANGIPGVFAALGGAPRKTRQNQDNP